MASSSYFSPGFKTRSRLLVAVLVCGYATASHAIPSGPEVVAGTAAFSQSGNTLLINNSNNAILNWQQFSIAATEAVRFNQPSASSSVLNRVLGPDPSTIYGQLSSNGKVWLINPAGILVGASGKIDTAGFVGSTLAISNENFLAGRLTFGGNSNAGSITNRGTIATPEGGSVYLVAPNVTNEGIITTPKGETILVAGQTVKLIDTATPGVNVEVTGAEGNATNLGSIVAEAGRIGVAGVLVKNSGTLNASSLVREGGRIFLKASTDTYVDQQASVTATGTKGGKIEVLGNRIALADKAILDASGQNAGGSVLVGGDYQGRNPTVQNASVTYVGPEASIHADATDQGDGGKVIVWADGTTRYLGSISARGGTHGGDGGAVETSGKASLAVAGRVNATAPHGKVGTWLLDPTNIEVKSGGEAGVGATQVDQFADIDVDNTAGGADGTTNTIDPATLDAAAANIVLQANSNITFTNDVSLTTAASSLTAQAGNNIAVNANISTTNGAVTLSAGDPGATGSTSTGSIAGSGNISVGSAGISATTNGGTGGINLTGTLTANAASSFSTGAAAITLSNISNSLGGAVNLTNSGSTNHVQIANSVTLTLGTLNIGGNLDVTTSGALNLGSGAVGGNLVAASNGYAITQSAGGLTVAGTSDIDAGAAAITLTEAGNHFTGAVSLTNSGNNNVSLRDSSALQLGTVSLGSGTLSIQSGGALTQSGPITQAASAGDFTVSMSNAGTDVTLDTQANDLTGTVILGGTITNFNNFRLRNTNSGAAAPSFAGASLTNLTLDFDNASIALPSLTISGTMTLKSGGAISSSGTLGANQLVMQAVDGVTNGPSPMNTQVGSLNVQNTGTGAIKISNSGGNLSIADIGSVGYGAKQLTSGQPILISNASTYNIGVNAPVTASGGDIGIMGPAGVSLTASKPINSGGGKVDIYAADANASINMPAGSQISSGGGDVTLKANNMTFTSGGTPSSIDAGSGTVKLTTYDGTLAIELGTGATDSAGIRLGLTDAELKTVTTSGTLTVGSPSNSGAMTLFGPLDLSSGAGLTGTLALDAGTNGFSVSYPITALAGLDISTGGSLSTAENILAGGNISLTADKMTLNTAKTVTSGAGAGTVTLYAKAGNAIDIGSASDATASTLELSAAEIDSIHASTLVIAGNGSGDMTVSTAIAPANISNLSLQSAGDIAVNGNLTATGDLGLQAVVSSAGKITSNSTLSGANITLKAGKLTLGSGTVIASGNAALIPYPGNAIHLGTGTTDDTASTIELSNAELNTINASTLRIGDANSGAIDIQSSLATSSGEALAHVSSGLSLTSGSTISQQSGATVAALSGGLKLSGSAVTMDQANPNSIVAGIVSAGNFLYRASGSIDVNQVDGVSGINASGGHITLDAVGGDMTVSNPINTSSGALNLYASGAVALNNAVTLPGGNFSVAGAGGTGRAASFSSTAPGTITTTGGTDISGGSVTIATTGSMVTQTITTTGGTVTNVGRGGGSVALHATDGTITTGSINTSGSDAADGGPSPYAGGSAGAVTVQVDTPTAARPISVGTITTTGGAGGATLTGAAGGAGGAGGNVLISTTTNGAVTTDGIDTSGGVGGAGPSGYVGGLGGSAGTITVRSFGAANNTSITVNLYAAGGDGGAATSATTGAGGAGGNLTVSSDQGAVDMLSFKTSGGLPGAGGTPGSPGAASASNTITGPAGVTIDAGSAIKLTNTGVSNGGGAATGPITLTADRMALTGGTVTAGAGTLWLKPSTASWNIDLGSSSDSTASTLELSATELNTLSGTGTLRIGATTAGNLHLSGPVNATGYSTGILALESGGTVTQATAADIITASKLAIRAYGDVTLDTAPNLVGQLSAAIGNGSNINKNLLFKNGQALIVGNVDSLAGIVNSNFDNTTAPTAGGIASLTTTAGTLSQAAGATLAVKGVNAVGYAGVDLPESNPTGVISGSSTTGGFSYHTTNAISVSQVNGISGISATAGDVKLRSDHASGIGQAANMLISSTGLALQTIGPVNLPEANAVTNLAADLSGGSGNFLLKSINSNLDIGTVQSILGITAAGNVAIGTTGNIVSSYSGTALTTTGTVNLVAGWDGSSSITAPTVVASTGNITLTNAKIHSGGAMSVFAGNAIGVNATAALAGFESAGSQTIKAKTITLNAGSSGHDLSAVLGSSGTQEIGAEQLALNAGGGASGYNNSASIYQGSASGGQSITIANGGSLSLYGGSGMGMLSTYYPGICTDCASQTSHNVAEIVNKGSNGQTLDFLAGGSITLTGGTLGNANYAQISNASSSLQKIWSSNANYPSISLNGGASGGVWTTNNFSLRNSAEISVDETAGTQDIRASTIGLSGNGSTTTVGGAFLGGGTSQAITTTGNVALTGGGSNVATPGEALNVATPAAIGSRSNVAITMSVGGNLNLDGGTGSSAPAFIGSLNGTTTGTVTVAGTPTLTQGTSSALIKTTTTTTSTTTAAPTTTTTTTTTAAPTTTTTTTTTAAPTTTTTTTTTAAPTTTTTTTTTAAPTTTTTTTTTAAPTTTTTTTTTAAPTTTTTTTTTAAPTTTTTTTTTAAPTTTTTTTTTAAPTTTTTTTTTTTAAPTTTTTTSTTTTTAPTTTTTAPTTTTTSTTTTTAPTTTTTSTTTTTAPTTTTTSTTTTTAPTTTTTSTTTTTAPPTTTTTQSTTTTTATTTTTTLAAVEVIEQVAAPVVQSVVTKETVSVTAAVSKPASQSAAAPAPPPPTPIVATGSSGSLSLLKTNQTIGGTEGTFGGAPTTTIAATQVTGNIGTSSGAAGTLGSTGSSFGTGGSSAAAAPASTSGTASASTSGSSAGSSGPSSGGAAGSGTTSATDGGTAASSGSEKPAADKPADKPAESKSADKPAGEEKKEDEKKKEDKKEESAKKQEDKKPEKKPAMCS